MIASIYTCPKKMVKLKGTGNPPNKALYCRVSYLYQAANYLATQQTHYKAVTEPTTEVATDIPKGEIQCVSGLTAPVQPASRRLICDLRAVSHKAQIRMSPAMKHTICKNCDTFLIDGSTCTSEIENKSKGGKKPWADILVRRCNKCGAARRYPVSAERQKRRPNRSTQDPDHAQNAK